MTDRSVPIVVEQSFNVSVAELWDAITQVDHMCQWFFSEIPAFEPKAGFHTSFVIEFNESRFDHQWKIIEVEEMKMIKYHWSYTDIEGVGYVTFELSGEGNQSRLKLTNTGLDSFPNDVPEFTREAGVEGWKYFIQQRLKDYLS